MQQPQQPKNNRKKPAKRAGILAVAAVCAAAAVGAGPQTARAVVVPPHRTSNVPAAPQKAVNGTVLPLDSSLFFVLDGTISSRLKAGTIVRAHLRDPIVLSGKTVAPAGSPVDIEISQSTSAQMGNQDGSVDIYFKSFQLADGRTIPLTTPTGHIDPHMSVGQYNTRATVDTIGDIFIPGHYIYHMLRKGHDVALGAGTVLRARTGASIALSGAALVIATPPPIVSAGDAPHSEFSPAPVYTPPGFIVRTPKPSPSVKPTSTP